MRPVRLHDSWSDERAAVVGQRVKRVLRQRQRATRVLATMAAIAVVAGGAVALHVSQRTDARLVHFRDGSTASGGVLTTLVDRDDEIRVRLDSGSAEFEVVKRPGRTFRVEVPHVAVEVVGTHFTVSRAAASVTVAVSEGRVHVRTAGESVELTAGQQREFALIGESASVPAASRPVVSGEAAEAPVEAPPSAKSTTGADWRAYANHGEYERAQAVLKPGNVRDEPKDLLLASDVARLSGHSEQARVYLQQLLDRHPKDRRAPLAAFTLGRVLLEELGWPREAAGAFARARALDPSGPLAEDSLAREVESWSRAGDGDRARAAAELYLQSYPHGQRTLAVRKHGGL